MIKVEYYKTRKDGVNLYRTYSDENYMIQKVGTDEIYDETIDIENSGYEYIETKEKIEDTTLEQAQELYEEVKEN